MKRCFFIPAVMLFTAFFSRAQQKEQADHIMMKQPSERAVSFYSSLHIANPILLPPNGMVNGYINGQLIFTGQVKKQQLQGQWQSRYTNNRLLDSGYLRNGIPDGEWKLWDSSGQLMAIRHYDADRLQRVKEEMRLGHPKRNFYPLTALYKTNRQAALYHLQAVYSFSFAAKPKTPQSLEQVVASNNSHHYYSPVFAECLHHGLYMNFFPGGIAKDSGYYKNGLREAYWLHRSSPTGFYYTGAYKNGLRCNEWKQYDGAGRLRAVIFYNNRGQVEWEKTFNR